MDREISLSQKRKEQRKLILRYGGIVVGIVIVILVIISLLEGSISTKNMVVGSVDKGTISPLSGFENYQKIYDEINEKVVGIKTSEGTAVTRQSKHFMDRVIGTMKDPKTGRSRSGVTVEGIRDALENPAKVFPTRTDPDSRKSQKYIGRHGTVSLDPETGILIQCNPTDADYVRRIANGNAKI